MSTRSDFVASNAKAQATEGYRRVAPGWHKWRQEFHAAGAAVSRAMLNASGIQPGMRVLDVACGPGEFALLLAPLVGPTGYVVAIDLVPEMLPKRSATGAISNILWGLADGETLPFRDGTFDLVACRAAIMHFPNEDHALSEAYRVLRPGGRAVFSALGPAEDTPAIMSTIAVIARQSVSRPDAANGPDIYRFGIPGTLSALFASAGFHEVREEMFTAPCTWPGDAKHFWKALPEHAWGVGELIERLSPDARKRVAREAVAALREYERDGMLYLTAPIVLASATR